LALAQRYFFKTYDQGVNPATVTTAGNRVEQLVSTNIRIITVLPVSMRSTPTVVFYAPGTGATGNATDNAVGNISVTINSAGTGSYIALNNGGGTATRVITSHSTADAEL
jgi:hypothetical protein